MQSAIEFDEFDSNRKVKELSSLMREKPWQIFYTVTTNDNGRRCLSQLHLAFKIASNEFMNAEDLTKESTHEHWNYWDAIDYDKETYKKFCERHLMLIN